MIEGTEHGVVGAYWRDRKLTAREFIHSCFAFLSELKTISKSFSNRCIVVRQQCVPLPDDFQSFERAMAEYLTDPENVYANPDTSTDSFTLDSTLLQGFVASFSDPNPNATSESAISIFAAAGAHGHPNATGSAVIKLPPRYASLVADSNLSRALLNVMVDTWRSEFVSIFSRELIRVLDPKRVHKRPFGVLMYFTDDEPASAIGDTADIEVRDSGGIVVTIPVSQPWAAGADVCRPCFDRLASAGFLE